MNISESNRSRTFAGILLFGLLAMTARNATDPDLWWHLRTGQWIVETGHIPHSDPFSFTRAGSAWVSHEWLSGRLLSELVLDPAMDLEAMARTGAALAELHSQQPAGLDRLTRRAEGATLLSLSANLGFVLPHLSGRFDGLARRLADSLAEESPVYQPIHGDFYAKQVLLGENTVAFLDLDRAAYGDPAADLGLFVAHLEREALWGTLTAGRLEALRDALLEGYREATRRPIPSRLELYIGAGLFRLTPDPFRFRESSWPERTEAILDRSETILRGPRRVTDAGRVGGDLPGTFDG